MSISKFDSPESQSPESGDPRSRRSRRAGFRVRGRALVVTVSALAVVTAVAVVGFGSFAGADTSGSGSSGSSGAAPQSFPRLTTQQKMCMKNALGDLIPAPGSTFTVPSQTQIKNDIAKVKNAATTCGLTLPAGGLHEAAGLSGLTTQQKMCMKNALGDLIPAPGSTLHGAVPNPDQERHRQGQERGDDVRTHASCRWSSWGCRTVGVDHSAEDVHEERARRSDPGSGEHFHGAVPNPDQERHRQGQERGDDVRTHAARLGFRQDLAGSDPKPPTAHGRQRARFGIPRRTALSVECWIGTRTACARLSAQADRRALTLGVVRWRSSC